MQNKPNFRKTKMNVTSILTKDYKNETLSERGKNKANSKPIKANKSQYNAKTNPIPQRDTQYAIRDTRYKPNQTRSEAEIPTGELLGILKPGTKPPTPVFTPKTNVAPKNNLKKPYFSLNLDNFSP